MLTALSRWRKKDPTIPKLKGRRIGKTIVDCKEQIIAHVRANPNCHTADLVKIASDNNVHVTQGSVAAALSRWRKKIRLFRN